MSKKNKNILRKCTWCGKEYFAANKKSRYCSDACKMLAYRNRKINRVTMSR